MAEYSPNIKPEYTAGEDGLLVLDPYKSIEENVFDLCKTTKPDLEWGDAYNAFNFKVVDSDISDFTEDKILTYGVPTTLKAYKTSSPEEEFATIKYKRLNFDVLLRKLSKKDMSVLKDFELDRYINCNDGESTISIDEEDEPRIFDSKEMEERRWGVGSSLPMILYPRIYVGNLLFEEDRSKLSGHDRLYYILEDIDRITPFLDIVPSGSTQREYDFQVVSGHINQTMEYITGFENVVEVLEATSETEEEIPVYNKVLLKPNELLFVAAIEKRDGVYQTTPTIHFGGVPTPH